MRIISISQQATGAFNNGQIIENKPIGFPQDKGFVRPYSSLLYWARAEGMVESTIGLHPHKGFEILSFVLKGNIEHFDTKANDWIPLQTGDVQVIRSGSGISHAEKLAKGSEIFQIWFDPDLSQTMHKPPSYDDYRAANFITEESNGAAVTYYAGERGIINLDTPNVDIRRILVRPEYYNWEGKAEEIRSLYVISGGGMINGKTVEENDFIILEPGEEVIMIAHELMDVFAVTVPMKLDYSTYAERLAS